MIQIYCNKGHSFELDEAAIDSDLIGAILVCPFPLENGSGSVCGSGMVWKRAKAAKATTVTPLTNVE